MDFLSVLMSNQRPLNLGNIPVKLILDKLHLYLLAYHGSEKIIFL